MLATIDLKAGSEHLRSVLRRGAGRVTAGWSELARCRDQPLQGLRPRLLFNRWNCDATSSQMPDVGTVGKPACQQMFLEHKLASINMPDLPSHQTLDRLTKFCAALDKLADVWTAQFPFILQIECAIATEVVQMCCTTLHRHGVAACNTSAIVIREQLHYSFIARVECALTFAVR